jgi:hypothetical protein
MVKESEKYRGFGLSNGMMCMPCFVKGHQLVLNFLEETGVMISMCFCVK